jgi:hypothetical protein
VQILKWVIFAVVGILAFNWLRNGLNASASVRAQVQPNAWGSGIVYAPGSSWQGAYGYYPPPQYYRPVPMVTANYSNDGGIDVGFSYGG